MPISTDSAGARRVLGCLLHVDLLLSLQGSQPWAGFFFFFL